jgi:hypothetical protein
VWQALLYEQSSWRQDCAYILTAGVLLPDLCLLVLPLLLPAEKQAQLRPAMANQQATEQQQQQQHSSQATQT